MSCWRRTSGPTTRCSTSSPSRSTSHGRGPVVSSSSKEPSPTGRIDLHRQRAHGQGAKADAAQTNRNLVLGAEAEAFSVPNLNIEENDVRVPTLRQSGRSTPTSSSTSRPGGCGRRLPSASSCSVSSTICSTVSCPSGERRVTSRRTRSPNASRGIIRSGRVTAAESAGAYDLDVGSARRFDVDGVLIGSCGPRKRSARSAMSSA